VTSVTQFSILLYQYIGEQGNFSDQ
jgi:hypothetical protein